MEKIFKNLQLSFLFTGKYVQEYFISLLKYILIICVGAAFAFLAVSFSSPLFALLTLFVGLPAICYGLWKGYVATYALNFAAYDFIREKPKKAFRDYVDLSNKLEGELIKLATFMAFVIMFGYLPSIFYFVNNLHIESLIIDPMNTIINMKSFMVCITINTLLLAPFINFLLQAFFFKKKENYLGLFLNCYTVTGLLGFVVSSVILIVVSILNGKAPVIYAILLLPLNTIIYSFNLFLYLDGLKKKMV